MITLLKILSLISQEMHIRHGFLKLKRSSNKLSFQLKLFKNPFPPRHLKQLTPSERSWSLVWAKRLRPGTNTHFLWEDETHNTFTEQVGHYKPAHTKIYMNTPWAGVFTSAL